MPETTNCTDKTCSYRRCADCTRRIGSSPAKLVRNKSKRVRIVDELEISSREQAYHLMKIDPKIESIYIYAPLGCTEYELTRAERDRNGYRTDKDANGIACIGWSNCE